jgi:hypothetical protein
MIRQLRSTNDPVCYDNFNQYKRAVRNGRNFQSERDHYRCYSNKIIEVSYAVLFIVALTDAGVTASIILFTLTNSTAKPILWQIYATLVISTILFGVFYTAYKKHTVWNYNRLALLTGMESELQEATQQLEIVQSNVSGWKEAWEQAVSYRNKSEQPVPRKPEPEVQASNPTGNVNRFAEIDLVAATD